MTVSWVTVLVAGVPSVYEAVESYYDPRKRYLLRKRRKQKAEAKHAHRQINPWPTSDLDRSPFRKFADKCDRFLGPLCDFQAITSIAIIISGWAQIETIDFYHEELVISYWWLTINSFWAGRANYLDFDSEDDEVRIGIRRLTILCSCIFGLSFQGYIIRREYRGWNDDGGPCYRFLDGSSPIPWMVGVGLFSIALLSTLFERTRKLNEWYYNGIESVNKDLRQWYENSQGNHNKSSSRGIQTWLKGKVAGICRSLWFAFVLWLSVWSYGDSFRPAAWVFYALFNTWTTFDIISQWHLNQAMIKDEEERKIRSFGQVLPLVLIGALIFNAVDVLRGKQ
jgi:hypothetical protein